MRSCWTTKRKGASQDRGGSQKAQNEGEGEEKIEEDGNDKEEGRKDRDNVGEKPRQRQRVPGRTLPSVLWGTRIESRKLGAPVGNG